MSVINLKKIVSILIEIPREYKILIVLFFDIIFSIISMYLAITLSTASFRINIFEYSIYIFLSILFFIPIFALFGFYNSIFRYAGVQNFLNILLGSVFYGFLFILIIHLSNLLLLDLSSSILQPIFLFIFILFSRLFYSFLITYNTSNYKNILIYGAGNLGVYASSVLNKYFVFGYIDDDKNKIGKKIYNKSIFKVDQIKDILKKNDIQLILIAISNLSLNQRREIILNLQKYRVRTVFFPSFEKIATGEIKLKDLERIKLEDLIDRKIHINTSKMRNYISNKVILITGAGGSIGSELVKQISIMKPKSIILIDHNEFNLYQISKFLNSNINFDSNKVYTYLSSITNYEKMNEIFNIHKPELVYHAAAYKHVPLAENNINEYFNNNVIGTTNIANLSIDFNIKHFFFISTDKAVRPTNVMGATKRFAEIFLQSLSVNNMNKNTIISSIRFGNVLGSNGSVVPLFNEQIENGGPVTVTHPDVTRYFMTIPEAVSLVISSIQIANNGSIFFLDMGKPIKIYDLAKKMIGLHGLKIKNSENPNGDIEIKFIGLRDGEKLHEELYFDQNPKTTELLDVFKSNDKFIDLKSFSIQLKNSVDALKQNDENKILEILKNTVEGYK